MKQAAEMYVLKKPLGDGAICKKNAGKLADQNRFNFPVFLQG